MRLFVPNYLADCHHEDRIQAQVAGVTDDPQHERGLEQGRD